MNLTAYDLAQRYVGIAERVDGDHPLIVWWHSLCGMGDKAKDEVPWCSSFVNGIAWELRLPRSKSAAARSWLTVGTPIPLTVATPEFDIVVLRRGTSHGADVLKAPGHVGFFAGIEGSSVLVLGGNQGNRVSVARFPVRDVLGVRRLAA